jgi:tetratricopeptide (TPR) repeat protein
MPALEPTAGGERADAAAATGGCSTTTNSMGRKAPFSSFRRLRSWIALMLLLGLLIAGYALASPQLRAWHHLRAARLDLERYHNFQAIAHLQACLRIWPTNAEALLLSARAARRAGAYDEAERGLEKYRDVRGLDATGSFEELLLSAERNVEQVAAVCRHHVEQGHPESPLILEALSRGYLRQYRLQEANFCLDLWLKSQPDNTRALCLKGQFHLDYEKSPDRAVESYRRAVQLDPEHEEARLGLAIVFLETKSFGKAAEQLEYLCRCQPNNLRVRVGLAQCRHALGESDEALRLVEAVLAQQPDYAPALTVRGEIAIAAGQYLEGETWLRRAVQLAPSDHQARYHLILSLHHNGHSDEAKLHEQALKQFEDDAKRFNRIVTQEMIGKPQDPDLFAELGQLLLRSGHREEGLRWLQNALRLDPQNALARKTLTEYHKNAETQDDKVTR